jgi:capsular polysaccharide biosynthesis protein
LLEEIYRSVARRWRVLLGVAVLTVMFAVALGLFWPDRYTSTASVTVEAIPAGEGTLSDVNMETQRLIAQSEDVLSLAVDEIGSTTVPALRAQLQVQIPRGSQVLEFSITSEDAEDAAAKANAIAAAYLDHRVANAQRRITEASDALTATADELTQQAATLAPDDPIRASLESQVRALYEQRAGLIATSFDAGSLIDPAAPASDTDTPAFIVFVSAGLFLGIFLGAFVALITDRVMAARAVSRNGVTPR